MRLVWVAAVLLLAASGCSKNGKSIDNKSQKEKFLPAAASEDGPRKGGKLIIGVQQEPEMLSEILNSMATNNMVCNLIFSKFVRYNDSLKLVPDLIKEIPSLKNGGVSPDYLSYTYHIRKDAFWHDGIPVTSRDVKFTYEIIMDPLVNVESREGWDVIESIDIPNEKTVVFHLKHHYPDFIEETFYDESVLPEHILSSRRGAKFHSSTYHHAPVGSGPFKFKKWVSGSHLVLEGNTSYYGEGPYLDEIIFKFIPDVNTLLVQLKTGEIDFFDNAEINFLDQIENIPGIKVYKTPMLMYEHLDLNNDNPILKDKLVRKALCYATNKREIAEKIYGNVVRIADLDEFPASKYYNSEAALDAAYNPLEARKLLHKAGWMDSDKDGILEKNGKKLALTISTTSGQINRERTEVVLMNQYKEIGVDLRIKNYNPTVLYGTFSDGGILKTGKFDIAMYAWLSSPEPATKEALYSSRNIPPKGQNHPRIKNEDLSNLLAEGSKEVDEIKRIEIYKRIAEILVDETPVIPLFWYTSIDACSERLHNLRPNPTQSSDTWNAGQWYMTKQP